MYITPCKIHSLWEAAIWHRSSAQCSDDPRGDDLYGGWKKKLKKKEGIYVYLGMMIHAVGQKLTQHYTAIILQ